MIQVGQWYGSHVVSLHRCFLYHSVLNCKQNEVPQARKRIRKPTVSFIDVNREFAIRGRSSESASDIGSDREDNSNSDADDEDITEDDLIRPILDGLVTSGKSPNLNVG